MSLLTKPGEWFISREKYKTFSDFNITQKNLEKLCEADRALILEDARRTDIKAFSFMMWVSFFLIIGLGIVGILKVL